MKKGKKIFIIIIGILVIVLVFSGFTTVEKGKTEIIQSPLYSVRAEQTAEYMAAPSNVIQSNEVIEGKGEVTPNTPLSLNPWSACVGSLCFGSGCGGSLCFGSTCGASGCTGSNCGASGCAGSTCGISGCAGSVCGATGCIGSVCAGECD